MLREKGLSGNIQFFKNVLVNEDNLITFNENDNNKVAWKIINTLQTCLKEYLIYLPKSLKDEPILTANLNSFKKTLNFWYSLIRNIK